MMNCDGKDESLNICTSCLKGFALTGNIYIYLI